MAHLSSVQPPVSHHLDQSLSPPEHIIDIILIYNVLYNNNNNNVFVFAEGSGDPHPSIFPERDSAAQRQTDDVHQNPGNTGGQGPAQT